MRTWLVTGGSGMLAQQLVTDLRGEVRAPSRAELDITDVDAVDDALEGVDIVVNAAAYTKVDDAEEHEAEAMAVNADAAARVAAAAQVRGVRVVQLSTDYVFNGRSDEPYPEDAPVDPINAYGRTKAEGERRVRDITEGDALIVRVSWLYGAGGPNFPRTILRLLREKDEVPVVTDQVGQPTWTGDVADAIVRLVDAGAPGGVYHATNSGKASWFEFARTVASEAGIDPDRVVPTTSAAFPRPAQRPAWSVLGHAAWTGLGLPQPRDWREALHDAMRQGALEG
jgi:dTDP-4-dehydrorhamnose reductase